MNLELWQILANQAFDDDFYEAMIVNVPVHPTPGVAFSTHKLLLS